jgi:hypothetical protein
MGVERGVHRVLGWGNQTERCQWADSDVDGKIIIIIIITIIIIIIIIRNFRKLEGVVGTGWSWFRIGTGGG